MESECLLTAASIFEKIWQLSPEFYEAKNYLILQQLTQQLISIYTAEGRLDENPFYPTTKRSLYVPEKEIMGMLEGKTCLVTGGMGCVGSCLVAKLRKLGAGKIIVLDKAVESTTLNENGPVIYVAGDITDAERLLYSFHQHQPDFVFHTAAQRDPGYAEKHIAETVQVNIAGTLNVLRACELTPNVKNCVFSSTGKASRYYTNEVYAATKKICEYIFDTYAKRSRINYAMVRFTHILDNSLMDAELKNTAESSYAGIHSPGKYVTAQNVAEAADLMLNALLHKTPERCNFLIVKQLEWPVESLEVALYYIRQSGKNTPIVFKGNPPGYTEKFFRGQMDWSQPEEMHLLINVYEQKKSRLNGYGNILISTIVAADQEVLEQGLNQLLPASGELETKEALLSLLEKTVRSALRKTDPHDTEHILNWGLEPQHLAAEGTTAADYGLTVTLLQENVDSRTSSNSGIYGTCIDY